MQLNLHTSDVISTVIRISLDVYARQSWYEHE